MHVSFLESFENNLGLYTELKVKGLPLTFVYRLFVGFKINPICFF